MLLPELLQKRMILLILFVYMGVAYFGGVDMFKPNFNVGWVTNVNSISPKGWMLFVIGYLLVAVFKKDTNVRLSALHLMLLLVIFVIDQWAPNADPLLWFLWGICFVVFAFNIRWALVGKE